MDHLFEQLMMHSNQLASAVEPFTSSHVNARTVPVENIGYFDSKVFSQQHAEVWEESRNVRRRFCFWAWGLLCVRCS